MVELAGAHSTKTQIFDRSLLKGIAWSGGVKWGVQVLSWISTLFVARLLSPTDYGLFGMAAVVLNFLTMVNEFGLGAAVIARRDLSQAEIAQLNGFAVLLSIIGLMVTSLMAAPVARYFGSPNVEGILLTMSGLLVLGGLRSVPASLLERDLQFKTLALIEGGQSVVQAFAAVALALLGFGYWALALSLVIGGSFSAGAVLFLHRHPLAWPRAQVIRQIVTTGWQLLVTRVVWYFSSSSDVLVAGRMLGASAVGTYSMAWSIAMVPVDKVTSLIGRVAFPLFASVQQDISSVRRYLLSFTEGLALVTIPAACGLAIIADDVVQLALGEQWGAVVVPLRLLAAFTALRSITPLLPHILNVTNGTRYGMYNSVFAALLGIAAFYVGSFWGVAGIALAWVIVHPITTVPLFVWVFRALHISVGDYLRAVYPALSSTLVMAVVLGSLRQVIPEDWSLGARFVLEVVFGGIAYAATILLIHQDRVRTFLSIVRAAPPQTSRS